MQIKPVVYLISVVVVTSHVGPRARGQFAVPCLTIVMEFEYPVTARPVSSDVHFCCRLFVSVTVSDGASLIVFFPADARAVFFFQAVVLCGSCKINRDRADRIRR